MPHEVSAINRVRDQARRQMQDLSGFDYAAPAELFPSGNRKGKSFFAYKRFDTAAEACASRSRNCRSLRCSVHTLRSTRRDLAFTKSTRFTKARPIR